MQWTDVTSPASSRVLRQFAGLLVLFSAAALGWRVVHGRADLTVWMLAGAGVAVGLLGLTRPAVIRPVYHAAMLAAFPIGWLVSRVALAAVFYLVITPVAFVFRISGRDALRRRRASSSSYWRPKPRTDDPRRYLRQF